MGIPERLRAARFDASGKEIIAGLELDRLAGLTRGHVSQIETGNKPNPTADTLEPIARVLGLSLDWLIRGIGSPPSDRRVRSAVEAARAASASTSPTR